MTFEFVMSLVMIYSYAEKWSRSYKEALKPLTEEQARQRHEAGSLYTVLLGEKNRPHTIIETRDHYFGVEFMDEQLRPHSVYQFKRQPDGRLFMVMAVFREFQGDSTKLQQAHRLSFEPDGHVRSFETDYVNNPNEETVVEKYIDVSLNWEPYPAFGDYASIARFDRDKPAAEQAGVTA